MLSNSIHKFLIAVVCVVAVCSSGFAQINVPQRFVQFRTLDFENGVVELHNFGTTSQSLNGWRFCSHDELSLIHI